MTQRKSYKRKKTITTSEPKTACICPFCGETAPIGATECSTCKSDLLLEKRYTLLSIIGDNNAITYLGYDTTKTKKVIIKELSIRKMKNWKEEELFLREVQVLRSIHHPRIPGYLDYFKLEAGKHFVHYLVLEYIEGTNLCVEFMEKRYTDTEILDLVIEILEILVFLQKLNPPLIHRDIKLSNIIRMNNGKPALIDFGAVKEWIRKSFYGETVTGTFGYMAPEQFYGEGVLQTDIYAVGITALVLYTRLNPDQMISGQNTLVWQKYVARGSPLFELFFRFLQPDFMDRPADASQALLLARKISGKYRQHPVPTKPLDSAIPSPEHHQMVFDSRSSWSGLITEFSDIPIEYTPFFPAEASQLPHIVKLPEITLPQSSRRNEILLCVFDNRFCLLEKKQSGVARQEYDFDDILYFEQGTALLHSWLLIHTKTEDCRLPYNTVDDYIFSSLLEAIRRRLHIEKKLPYSREDQEVLSSRLEYIRTKSLKFYNYGSKAILPGSIIHGTFFQSQEENGSGDHPSRLWILTDNELIFLEEPDQSQKTPVHQYGMVRTCFPLAKIRSIDTGNGTIALTLSSGKIVSTEYHGNGYELNGFKTACAAFSEQST